MAWVRVPKDANFFGDTFFLMTPLDRAYLKRNLKMMFGFHSMFDHFRVRNGYKSCCNGYGSGEA